MSNRPACSETAVDVDLKVVLAHTALVTKLDAVDAVLSGY